MAPVDRKNPVRGAGSESGYSIVEFMREFPDDAACLDYLWRQRFSPDGLNAWCDRCQKSRPHRRYEGRHSYDCTSCGKHVSVTAGTIFHKSSTSLQLWFYAMYVMASTRCGISAKQLERERGVTYKTAWRMFNLIRNKLMADDGAPLTGAVEADETLIGGRMRNSHRREREKMGWDRKRYDNERKTMVFAVVEREGRVKAQIIPNSSGPTLRGAVRENVTPGTTLYTDEWVGYRTLEADYPHLTIRHRDGIYAQGTTHTQTIEGFFGLLKNALRGVHHGVSDRWLQSYLNEYAWRYNNRGPRNTMFRDLIDSAAKTPAL
jgi:transposase